MAATTLEVVMILKYLGLWASAAEAVAVAVAAVASDRALADDETLGGLAAAVPVGETFFGALVGSAAVWRSRGNDVYPCERACLWRGGWSKSCGE